MPFVEGELYYLEISEGVSNQMLQLARSLQGNEGGSQFRIYFKDPHDKLMFFYIDMRNLIIIENVSPNKPVLQAERATAMIETEILDEKYYKEAVNVDIKNSQTH